MKIRSALPLIVTALQLVGATATAVEPGLPSKTAVWAAAARTVGAKNPDATGRNPDYLAIKFLGPRERALLPEYDMPALDIASFAEAMKRLGANLPVTTHACLYARWGEPWLFGFPDDGAAPYVRREGLGVLSDTHTVQNICIAFVR